MATTQRHGQTSEPSRRNYEGQAGRCCVPLSESREPLLPAVSITAPKVNTCCCQMVGEGRVNANQHARPGWFLSCLNAATLWARRYLSCWKSLKQGGRNQVFHCDSTAESAARATLEGSGRRSARGIGSITRLTPWPSMPHDAAIMPSHL